MFEFGILGLRATGAAWFARLHGFMVCDQALTVKVKMGKPGGVSVRIAVV